MSSIDVLLKLEYLSQKNYGNWRFGKVKYLEKVCNVNLKKLTTINKTIKEISSQMGLKKSLTAYNKFGKGRKIRLRFSKSGNEQIEESYATHYLNMEKIENTARKHIRIARPASKHQQVEAFTPPGVRVSYRAVR